MSALNIETQVPLQSCNTFGIAAHAQQLLRVRSVADLQALHDHSALLRHGWLALGAGSNVVLSSDVRALVLKMEIKGRALVDASATHWIVELGAGENWHDAVAWTLQQGWAGLENLALIPGVAGAAPVQNIGAYGVELQDRFHSLDAVEIATGRSFSLDAQQCGFGYRDSVFKHRPAQDASRAWAGKAVITHVRLALPKQWRAQLAYLDIQRKMAQMGLSQPTAQQVFEMVVEIRRAKLPDPARVGNAGSFFKNPVIDAAQCAEVLAREPRVVHYPLPDGRVKLAAAWLIEACGWRGKRMGNAAVYDKQALVLINDQQRSGQCATGSEVLALARAIQSSVYERFGVHLEPEPLFAGAGHNGLI